VYLIHKQHAWNQLSNTLVDVLVHHLVDLPSKFVWETGK
jgi:hypothetical protein